jgi:hypothetical protein
MSLNPQSEDALRPRLEALEQAFDGLHARVGHLEAALAAVGAAPVALATTEARRRDQLRPAAEPLIFCPRCGAGNAAGTAACVQCRWALPAGAGHAAPGRPRPGAPQLGGMTAPLPPPNATAPPAKRPAGASGVSAAPQPARPPRPMPRVQLPRVNLDMLTRSEFWLNKVGVGLLLLGVAFLFKYSVDQGWLTAPLRVGFGLLIGAVLLERGLRFAETRPQFSQVLLGGGVGAFYITGFAAYQLLHVVPYAAAFGFMIAVTGLAFGLALRQNTPTLSLIGTIGGFATPFILYTAQPGVVGLVVYSALIMGAATALHWAREWRWLRLTAYAGFWGALAVGFSSVILAISRPLMPAIADQVALQAGVVAGWLAFWGLPLLRERLRTSPLATDLGVSGSPSGRLDPDAIRLAVGTTALAVSFTNLIWQLPGRPLSVVMLAAAALYAVVARAFWQRSPRLAYTQAALGVLLFTVGLVLLLNGDALLFALAAEGVVLHVLHRRVGDPGLRLGGHLICAAVTVWLAGRLALDAWIAIGLNFGPAGLTVTNWPTDLAVIALLCAAAVAVRERMERAAYQTIGVGALGVWLANALGPAPNGPALLMFAWGLLGAGLALLGRRFSDRVSRALAHIVFFGTGLPLLLILSGSGAPWGPLVSALALGTIAVVAAVSFLWPTMEEVSGYRLAAVGTLAWWLWNTLAPWPDGQALVMLAWAVLAGALAWLSARRADLALAALAHVVFAGAGLLLLDHLVSAGFSGVAGVTLGDFLGLPVIGLAVALSAVWWIRREALIYRGAAHLALLGWLWSVLARLPNGNGYVTVAWAAYAVALLVAGVRLGHNRMILYVALGTLAAAVAKLFLVDLVAVDTIWRIALFIGFGALLLALSYFFPNWLRPGLEAEADAAEAAAPGGV